MPLTFELVKQYYFYIKSNYIHKYLLEGIFLVDPVVCDWELYLLWKLREWMMKNPLPEAKPISL